MTPPAKGYGVSFVRFAIDEPEMFRLLFMERQDCSDLDGFLDGIGYRKEVETSFCCTFGLSRTQAESVYRSVWLAVYGMACHIVNGNCPLSLEEVSFQVGHITRGLVMAERAGTDEREGYIPARGDSGPEGSSDEYIGNAFKSLLMQNILLKSLLECPRYIQDNEWTTLEGVLDSAFGLSRKSLTSRYPALSPADFRIILLSKLGFSISSAADLLGISPASVTKARQRLKTKLGIDSIDRFVSML